MTSERKKRHSSRDVLRALRRPKVAIMLALGFASGLPFMLVGNTMGFWLREGGIELSTIGFLSWVGIAYSMKFLWAPLVDKTDAPVLGRLLGRRRGWMMLAQLAIACGLVGMALVQPQGGLIAFGAMALVAAFSSATQDIVIDAWRIESADDSDELALLSAGYQLGYRTALLITDALILVVAAKLGWVVSYELMALLMAVGIGACWFAREPQVQARPVIEVAGGNNNDLPLGVSDAMVVRWLLAGAIGLATLVFALAIGLHDDLNLDLRNAALLLLGAVLAWAVGRRPTGPVREATWSRPLVRPMLRMYDAVLGPFIAFFRQHGSWALLMLAAISLYRLPDFVMGPMANPFYADLGIAKETVGWVRGVPGLVASVSGIAAAGLFALRFGFVPTLLLGAILGPGSNLAFAWLAYQGNDPLVFATAMVIDNFCTGFAGVALVGYMSSLTNVGYSATQYALLSSFYALLGKVLKGFSGVVVEHLQAGRTELEGYALFFIGTAVVGIPALLLCVILARRRPVVAPASTPA